MNKILFVIGLTKSGGAEKRAILMSKLLKKNFETRVFAFSGDKNDDIDFVFKPTYEEYKKYNLFKRVKTLRNYIEQEKPDYVFSFVPHINFFTALALRPYRFKHIKHIVSIVFPSFSGINKIELKYALRNADAVYYQCSDQKEFTKCKCDSFVLANPLDVPSQIKHDTRLKFMSAGRLSDQKDYDLQIRAFALIVNSFKGATLDIYGSGNKKKELIELINELHLENMVFIHEYTDNLDGTYKNHDIFLFTTKKEGFPNVLAEAMSYGLICFTTDFSTGRKDLITDKETGFVCNSRDAEAYADMVINELRDYNNAGKIALNGYNHVGKICNPDSFVESITLELKRLK